MPLRCLQVLKVILSSHTASSGTKIAPVLGYSAPSCTTRRKEASMPVQMNPKPSCYGPAAQSLLAQLRKVHEI